MRSKKRCSFQWRSFGLFGIPAGNLCRERTEPSAGSVEHRIHEQEAEWDAHIVHNGQRLGQTPHDRCANNGIANDQYHVDEQPKSLSLDGPVSTLGLEHGLWIDRP